MPFGCEAGRRVAVLAIMAAIGACAQAGSWQNPNVPHDQWSVDRGYCMDGARNRAEQMSNRSLNYNLGGRWASDMNRFSGQRRQQQLFESCMTQRGYMLVPAAD